MFKAQLFIFFAKLNILVLGSPQFRATLYQLKKRNIIKNARFLGQISLILKPFNCIKMLVIRWRRFRDSNSSGTCIPYRFSRPTPSTTWVNLHFNWWTNQDLNPEPTRYERGALTNCAIGP